MVCAQSPFKWSPLFTLAVAEILLRTPHARLVVFDSPVGNRSRAFDVYLEHVFSPLGVDAKARVIRLPQSSRADFLAVLSTCDIALDSFGFSGGNTSPDCLSVGLPVLTLPGEFMRGRQTLAMLSMLSANAQSALVAADKPDFVRRAASLLASREELKALRSQIRNEAHALFDDPKPVAALRAWLMQNVVSA